MPISNKRKSVNILLVEDNLGDVRLTQEAFKEGKINITLSVATDGVEALSMLTKEAPWGDYVLPDLILLDLNLPKKHGSEVLATIKSTPVLKRIPVVVLTTSNADADVAKCYELNANCYINKPVDFDRFLDVVKSIEQFWLNTVILPTPKNN